MNFYFNSFAQRSIDFGSRALALILMFTGVILLFSLFIKAVFDVDTHFDSWWYHLPWASRVTGIMGSHEYFFEPLASLRFEGFPMLPEFFQGVFWRVTGRVESANLVNYFSLIAFIFVLHSYFRVVWWISLPALLAVPLIQGQVSSTYVDLIANLAMATFILMIFLAYVQKNVMSWKYLFVMSVAAIIAANSKLQLIPIIALAILFAAYPILIWVNDKQKKLFDRRTKVILLTIIVFMIFWVPIKNLMVHGNPVYPLKVDILGYELNSAEQLPPDTLGAGELSDSTRIKRWFYSVFEIGMGPIFNVKRWPIDSAAPAGSPMTIQGGLFGVYVVFHLLLFIWLLSKAEKRERNVAAWLVLLTMTIASLMPASNLLRYYMFWFICLISLNLYFLASLQNERVRNFLGGVFLLFVLIVIDATDQNYVHTRFYSINNLLSDRVDVNILNKIKQGSNVCLVLDKANEPFLYAPIWHDIGDYSVTAGPFDSEYPEEVKQACHGKMIIYSDKLEK